MSGSGAGVVCCLSGGQFFRGGQARLWASLPPFACFGHPIFGLNENDTCGDYSLRLLLE